MIGLTRKFQKVSITMTEEVDESFEIISEKEKMWRETLVEAETNYLKSEASMLQNDEMIKLAKAEIKKESEKNAR